MNCPYCRAKNLDIAKFCNSCGKTLILSELKADNIEEKDEQVHIQPKAPDTKRCPECGNDNPTNAKFCLNCGKNLIPQIELNPTDAQIDFVAAKCPECGATLQVEKNRKDAFCTYCGAKVLIHNENEHIYRTVDEAELKKAEVEEKKAETEQLVKLKKMEILEKEREDRKKAIKGRIKASIILGVIGTLMIMIGMSLGEASGDSDSSFYMLALLGMFPILAIMYVWLSMTFNNNQETKEPDGKIPVPNIVNDLKHKEYTEVESAFRHKGFHNIHLNPLKDLTLGIMKKDGEVASVTVGGDNVIASQKFLPDTPVVISYHSF